MIEILVKKDNTKKIQKEVEQAIKKALVEVGEKCTDYAVDLAPHDTGLLRNSITYALDGEASAKGSYHADEGDGSGAYSGTVPKESKNHCVYVGTNVEYAPYQEFGTVKMKEANPFIKPAVANHQDVYQRIFKDELSKIK